VKKGIAFFDFDGTITTKDTLLEFIRFSKGTSAFYTGFLLNSPYLVAFKTKLISNQYAKEKVLQHFFRGMAIEDFENLCKRFAEEKLPALIRPRAVEEIKKLQAAGYVVAVVSASPENWIRQWAASMGVELIGSRLGVTDGRLTGKINGKNCHGEEKVARIREKYKVSEYDSIHAYGDSGGDTAMLKIATHPFFKPFRD